MTDSSEPAPAAETDTAVRGSRRWVVLLLTSVFVVVLVAAGLVGSRLLGIWGPDDDPAAQPTASPTPTEPPSPFAGTPAEDFAEGADGIELPPAEPIGDYTADQVEEALEQVRDALIAARLERTMLVDHNPSKFLATVAPDLRSAIDDAFRSADFAAFATQVAEDAELAPATPRVAGTVSYDATVAERDLPVIEVTTRFVWVYAFETGDEQPSTDLVVVRDELVWLFRQGYPWTEDSQGLWLAAEDASAWGADCDAVADGELLPDEDPAASLTEQAEVIFDPEQPLDGAGSC